jgi:hypothetical protein
LGPEVGRSDVFDVFEEMKCLFSFTPEVGRSDEVTEVFVLRSTRQTLIAEVTDADISVRWLTLGGALLEHASDAVVAERQTRDVSVRWCYAEARTREARDEHVGATATDAVRQRSSW